MKRFNIVFVILCTVLGIGLSDCTENKPKKETTVMKNEEGLGKVIGIGGVFFKSQDPEKTKQWYEDHLGIEKGPYGHIFTWYLDKQGETERQTVWTPFDANTDYFGDNDMMINYIVDDIDAIVAYCILRCCLRAEIVFQKKKNVSIMVVSSALCLTNSDLRHINS